MTGKKAFWRSLFWLSVVGGTAVFLFAARFPPTMLSAFTLVWTATGSQVGEEYGYAVASAGDVNGDTYADLIVGAPHFDDSTYLGGAAFVFYGSAAGLSDQPDWTAGSELNGARFGFAVAAAGDVNDDGYDDVLIGAYRSNNEQPEEGRAYLYLGSAHGLADEPAWTYESNQKDAQLAYSVAGAGDVNDDGFDDVLVGARWYDGALLNEGAAFLFFGSEDGLNPTPDWTAVGGQTGAAFGTAVNSAGDTNQDGYDDFLVGAAFYSGTQIEEGAAFLYLGGPHPDAIADWQMSGGQTGSLFGAAVAAGDFNQDGRSDILVGAPHFGQTVEGEGGVFLFLGGEQSMSDTAVWSGFSQQEGALYGTAVATGDVNGDGLTDLMVGAPQYTHDQQLEGRVFLYLGTPDTLNSLASWTGDGDKAETNFGRSAGPAGDTNGDGFGDLAVGAPQFRTNRDLVGRAYVFFGAESISGNHTVFLPFVVHE
ncbi:MAG: FG-GAP repeat protein [Ardenticatenaceae bacterium]|nr:FG-GAP repeat protein [Ardenticatenaceae bacterium]